MSDERAGVLSLKVPKEHSDVQEEVFAGIQPSSSQDVEPDFSIELKVAFDLCGFQSSSSSTSSSSSSHLAKHKYIHNTDK